MNNQIYQGFFDSRAVPLSQKIRDAMARHEAKYGKVPNIVELPLNEERVEGLEIDVKYDRYILPHNIFVGVKRIEELEEVDDGNGTSTTD